MGSKKFDPLRAPFWCPKCGPNRPRKLPRWPSNAQKRAKMSSKSLFNGSFRAPLKPYKNTVFNDGLGPPSCPRATRDMPKSRHLATLSPQDATKRTARGDSDSELRKETETESEESQKRTPKESPKRGPERGSMMSPKRCDSPAANQGRNRIQPVLKDCLSMQRCD